jgi:hypothetical protein
MREVVADRAALLVFGAMWCTEANVWNAEKFHFE